MTVTCRVETFIRISVVAHCSRKPPSQISSQLGSGSARPLALSPHPQALHRGPATVKADHAGRRSPAVVRLVRIPLMALHGQVRGGHSTIIQQFHDSPGHRAETFKAGTHGVPASETRASRVTSLAMAAADVVYFFMVLLPFPDLTPRALRSREAKPTSIRNFNINRDIPSVPAKGLPLTRTGRGRPPVKRQRTKPLSRSSPKVWAPDYAGKSRSRSEMTRGAGARTRRRLPPPRKRQEPKTQ